jgi:hypothetical protein
MEVSRRAPWLYNFRSSETFIVIVVSIAIFTVSITIYEVLRSLTLLKRMSLSMEWYVIQSPRKKHCKCLLTITDCANCSNCIGQTCWGSRGRRYHLSLVRYTSRSATNSFTAQSWVSILLAVYGATLLVGSRGFSCKHVPRCVTS